jgi:hypothetical protein
MIQNLLKAKIFIKHLLSVADFAVLNHAVEFLELEWLLTAQQRVLNLDFVLKKKFVKIWYKLTWFSN